MGLHAVSLKDDALEVALVVVGVAAVIWYVEAQYQAAGGVTGLSSSLFSWAGTGLSNLGGAALDALPSSQVPYAVDTVQNGLAPGQTPTASELLWESALMGGG